VEEEDSGIHRLSSRPLLRSDLRFDRRTVDLFVSHQSSPGCSTEVMDRIDTYRAKWVRGGLYATAEPNGPVSWATVPFRSNVVEPNRPANRFTSP